MVIVLVSSIAILEDGIDSRFTRIGLELNGCYHGTESYRILSPGVDHAKQGKPESPTHRGWVSSDGLSDA